LQKAISSLEQDRAVNTSASQVTTFQPCSVLPSKSDTGS
jgi:hypothetical protein